MDGAQHALWKRDFDELRDVFARAAKERAARPGIDPELREPEWVTFERRTMHDAVNRIRARYGKPPVTEEAIVRVETSASGHTDYYVKFPLGCADIVHDRR